IPSLPWIVSSANRSHGLGSLGLVRMLRAGVNLELRRQRPRKTILRQHTRDRPLDQPLGVTGAQFLRTNRANPAREPGVVVIDLVALLLAGELHLGSVDD